MAVPITDATGGFAVGAPVVLFKTRLVPTTAISRQQYVVAGQGRRFLMVTTEDAPAAPITLLLNWRPRAER
jgi:hypothetical protein